MKTEPSRATASVPARDRLLSAAVEAFGELGYASTTTRDIASRAGMSPAAVYVHHAAKEDLLFAISHEGHREALEVLRSASASSTEPLARLHRMVHDFTDWHVRNSRIARVVQYELDALSSEHRADVAEMRHDIVNAVCEVLEAGANDGSMQVTSTRSTALAILSLSIDLVRWYKPGSSASADHLPGLHAALAVRMVAASAAS
jgi:AcrR family transcriptional regulator